VAPLGKTGYKAKQYLKKLQGANDNPRYAASKAGSVLGGLLCGMHKGDPADDLDDINHELVDGELDEQEEEEPDQEAEEGDEITFMGDTESEFFQFLKQQYGVRDNEDANTVATSAIDAQVSTVSGKCS
jgi:hypothetical protein